MISTDGYTQVAVSYCDEAVNTFVKSIFSFYGKFIDRRNFCNVPNINHNWWNQAINNQRQDGPHPFAFFVLRDSLFAVEKRIRGISFHLGRTMFESYRLSIKMNTNMLKKQQLLPASEDVDHQDFEVYEIGNGDSPGYGVHYSRPSECYHEDDHSCERKTVRFGTIIGSSLTRKCS